MSDMIPCPKCGAGFYVPSLYSNGSDGPAYRSCQCSFEQGGSSGGNLTPDETAHRIFQLEGLVKILMRTIRSSPKNILVANEDLQQYNQYSTTKLKVPKAMVENAIRRGDALYKTDNKGVRSYTLCLYCGMVNLVCMSPGDDTSILAEYPQTCGNCTIFKGEHPEVFDWVSNILKWGYLAEMVPMQKPQEQPEPEPAPEPKIVKNIIV